MRKAKGAVTAALVLVVGAAIYYSRRFESPVAVIGVVRATEVRVEPEVNGQLVSIAVGKGAQVHTGDILARLSAVELTAQADQARAALGSATANRNNVYVGIRREQVDSLKAQIAKASARLEYLQAQLTRITTLARQSFESQQALDQAESDAASARADVAEAQANYDAAVAGPTQEERTIADAQVRAAAASVAVLERRLEKMVLRAPTDGVISVVAGSAAIGPPEATTTDCRLIAYSSASRTFRFLSFGLWTLTATYSSGLAGDVTRRAFADGSFST